MPPFQLPRAGTAKGETYPFVLVQAVHSVKEHRRLKESVQDLIPGVVSVSYYVSGMPVFTRGASRFRVYVPTVRLICPEPGESGRSGR